MAFTFKGFVEDNGTWRIDVDVPNGQTVTYGDVQDKMVVPLLVECNGRRNERIPTLAECAAIHADYEANCAPPAGWEPTNDGISTQNMIDSGQRSFSRTYRRDDLDTDAAVPAPCGPNGEALPGTRAALLEYDAEHPRRVSNGEAQA